MNKSHSYFVGWDAYADIEFVGGSQKTHNVNFY